MKNIQKVIALGALVVVVVLGVVAFSVLRAPEEASAPIEAIPLAQSSAVATSSAAGAEVESSPAADEVEAEAAASTAASAASGSSAGSSAAASTATEPTTSSAAADGAASGSGPIVAQIVQEESEARFVIDEVLNNAPKTVVGATNQVAGEIAVDPQDPTKTRVGTIQVNARSLATDSEFRDRAIKNRILNTDQYEFVTFTPTQIVGLPANGSVGQSYSFQIIGDLTVRDVTKPVTFDVTATPISETRLEGTAQTTIRYADFGLTIPQVRQVASVSEQVRLEIDFVAVPR